MNRFLLLFLGWKKNEAKRCFCCFSKKKNVPITLPEKQGNWEKELKRKKEKTI